MGISASVAYGIALTDDFGNRLSHIPSALYDFASDFDPYGDDGDDEPPESIAWTSTDDDCALVLGVYVSVYDEDRAQSGLSLGDPAAVALVHEEFLKALSSLPEDMRALVDSLDQTPRLCLLCGPD